MPEGKGLFSFACDGGPWHHPVLKFRSGFNLLNLMVTDWLSSQWLPLPVWAFICIPAGWGQ